MANEYKIEINKRDDNSKQGLKQLRLNGNIPGIYYSRSTKNSVPIYINQKNYLNAIKSGARIFNISVADKKQNVLFKSVQYHPVTEEVLHIDLYGIQMDRVLSIKVPLQLIGDAIGVKDEGGIVNQPLNEIEISCLPADIPDFVELDITELSIGDSLNAADIILDQKHKLITLEDSVAVSVTQPMKEIEPVVEVEEDEGFMDEDAEPGEAESEADKDSDDGNKKDDDKDVKSE